MSDTEDVVIVVQEGGCSNELYLWAGRSLAEAERFRRSCSEEGNYRTTEPLRVTVPRGIDWQTIEDILDNLDTLGFP